MKKFLIFLLVSTVISVGIYMYMMNPKGLGVMASEADRESGEQKLGVKFESLPDNATQTIQVSGAHSVDVNLSSEELTALANSRREQYGYFPFRNVQIRVNADGSVEGSATINYDDAVKYLTTFGVKASDIERATGEFKIPKIDIPLYMKVSGNVKNNVSNIDVSAVTIASIPVPRELVDKYAPGVDLLVEQVIRQRQPSYRIDTLEVKDSKIHFAGTAPDVEMAKK